MYQSRIKDKKGRFNRYQKKRDLEYPDPDDGTYFAVVKDMLGNGRVRVLCEDGSLKIGRIRGTMRKSRGKTIIECNDLVMVSLRDFEDKLDIMYKYTADEVAQILKDSDNLPEKIYKSLTESEMCRIEGADDTIVFCNKDEDDEDEDENIKTNNRNITLNDNDYEDIDIDNI
ncbi:hypothetical protein [Dishui Lake large algae virus 1]|nr:hypothetical protein [Dishui Lake large algae virus 1]